MINPLYARERSIPLHKQLIVAMLVILFAGCNSSSETKAPQKEMTGTLPDENTNADLTITLEWQTPANRENGDDVLLSEIGGYEIRYRLEGVEEYTIVDITEDGSAVDSTVLQLDQTGRYEFQIASYDTDGLFSENSATIIQDID